MAPFTCPFPRLLGYGLSQTGMEGKEFSVLALSVFFNFPSHSLFGLIIKAMRRETVLSTFMDGRSQLFELLCKTCAGFAHHQVETDTHSFAQRQVPVHGIGNHPGGFFAVGWPYFHTLSSRRYRRCKPGVFHAATDVQPGSV